MKSLKILIASLLLVSQSYALSKNDRNLLVGITAGTIVGALYASSVHKNTVHADKHHKKRYRKGFRPYFGKCNSRNNPIPYRELYNCAGWMCWLGKI